MARPSMSLTDNESSVNVTSATRSSVRTAEIATPRLQQLLPMFFDDRLYPVQFVGGETAVSRQCHFFNPEFGREQFAVHMDVRRLPRFMRIKVNPVRPRPEHRRHREDCSGT